VAGKTSASSVNASSISSGSLDPAGSTNETADAIRSQPRKTMGDDMSKQVVLGIFADESAADAAAHALNAWDDRDDDVKVDAIGILVLDEDGKINTHKLGPRTVGKGAGIGIVLAVLAPPTLLAGALAGGAVGALHKKGLGIDSAERDRIADALGDGRAAVGALLDETQVTAVTLRLRELGGEVQVLRPNDDAVAEVDAVAAAETAEGSAPSAS
jgi:hypothetical protein